MIEAKSRAEVDYLALQTLVLAHKLYERELFEIISSRYDYNG